MPALLAGDSPPYRRRRAAALLDRVGLAGRCRYLPSAPSGGQRQWGAIARALVNEPLVVFSDEPTGNLDTAATHDVLRLFATCGPQDTPSYSSPVTYASPPSRTIWSPCTTRTRPRPPPWPWAARGSEPSSAAGGRVVCC
ncbi:ATP-binding cassette domain-containing protein [Streptomyces sp. enrichment culture]|uniref:ATP-binding cassette domain-containing protein n=1 Tax=Streptomyces sp. enrichment culture TaxID=1795815 RepID=UPI003F55175B